jgi:hypothetical protein
MLRSLMLASALVVMAAGASAKLPPPSDEAKAKAAEAAAKTAHGNKLGDYQLCRSRERVADRYRAEAKRSGKELGAAVDTPACVDPGAFVYTPAGAASAAAAAVPAKKG